MIKWVFFHDVRLVWKIVNVIQTGKKLQDHIDQSTKSIWQNSTHVYDKNSQKTKN